MHITIVCPCCDEQIILLVSERGSVINSSPVMPTATELDRYTAYRAAEAAVSDVSEAEASEEMERHLREG